MLREKAEKSTGRRALHLPSVTTQRGPAAGGQLWRTDRQGSLRLEPEQTATVPEHQIADGPQAEEIRASFTIGVK